MKMIPRNIFTLLYTCLCTCLAGYSLAAEPPSTATVVHMEAVAEQKVTPDKLHITLRIEHEAASPASVQNVINQKMEAATQYLAAQSGFKFSTGHYNVYQRWVRPQAKEAERQKIWHGQQQIILEGREQEELLTAAGKLQTDGFAINNMHYTISPKVEQTFQEALLTEAITNLKRRANKLARLLDKQNVHMARLNTATDEPRFYAAKARSMLHAEDSAMHMQAAPVARADEQIIKISISAEIWLDN